jgi:dTDP-4-amino-4,6-dideoxygalactose transaminase
VFSNFNDGAKNLEKVKLASKQTVSIPLHHNLTDEHIEYIITEVKDLYNWMNM